LTRDTGVSELLTKPIHSREVTTTLACVLRRNSVNVTPAVTVRPNVQFIHAPGGVGRDRVNDHLLTPKPLGNRQLTGSS
jgi:DNA-binding response OmpR family regulator